jgi:hypothetical protein
MLDKKKLSLYARVLCFNLAVFDLFLGGGTILFPKSYAALFHPLLADPPLDFIVRTGVIWLFFCFAQSVAFTRKTTEARVKWFFIVGILRLMDVPADFAYATLSQGATFLSRAALYSAPPINLAMGIFLVYTSSKLRKT